jgi:hypothetical protein
MEKDIAQSMRSSDRARTSLRRGALGLVLSPAFALAPLSVLLLLSYNLGLVGGCVIPSVHSQLMEIGAMAAVLGGGTFLLGLPTWMVLRLAHRESGWTYLLAGAAEGLLCALYAVGSHGGAIRLDQAPGFGLAGLAGGGIAWTFWRIARDPHEKGAR